MRINFPLSLEEFFASAKPVAFSHSSDYRIEKMKRAYISGWRDLKTVGMMTPLRSFSPSMLKKPILGGREKKRSVSV